MTTMNVKSGDTMTAIAKRYGVPLQELIAANPQEKNPNVIQPGDQITIPEKRAQQDRSTRSIPPPAVNPSQIQASCPKCAPQAPAPEAPPPASTAPDAPAPAPAPAPPPAAPAPATTTNRGGPGNDLVPNQFSIGGSEGMSACGPAALVAIEKGKGKDVSLPQALADAKQHGWTVDGGMNGFGNFAATARADGLDFKTGSTDDVKGQVEQGNPVVISTNHHYFVAQAYDPATNKYFFGNSGTAMRAGSQWLSLDQVAQLGGGINGVGWAQ